MSLEGSASSTDLKVLKGKIRSLSPYAVDPTLSVEGASADAKATGDALEKKVSITDIVDNLTSDVANVPLSAKQGKALKKSIDNLTTSVQTAQSAAENALAKAEEAKNSTNASQSTADTAQNTADSALAVAEEAKTIATQAQTTADSAVQASTKITETVTLTVANWSGNAQTVSVAGVTEYNTVLVTAAPDSYVAYNDAMVYCSAQGDGILTFACSAVPSSDLNVNVLILN